MYVYLLLLTFSVAHIAARQTDYCFADEDQPYLMMGTKTAYHFVHGKTRFQTIPNCKPVQIWVLARHGTRYPGRSQVTKLMTLPQLRDQIIYNHETRGFGRLCNKDLENLKNWHLDQEVTVESANRLTTQGAEDIKLLARRLQSYLPELLQPDSTSITSDNYKFRSTNTQRTKASMDSFMEGLFRRNDAVPVQPTPSNDTLLKAYENCPRWTTEVEDNPDAVEEVIKFGMGPEFTNILQNVSQRLGFLNILTAASVGLMYEMCRYDKAWKVIEISPWCAVFSKEELKVLEYQEDLSYYYASGYGNDLNHRLGCPPMQDMMNHFKKLEGLDYSGEPKGVFYFSHTTTLQLFYTAMGFAKDSTPLLADNYQTMGKRQWQTSLIGPFAANVAAVFYKCNTAGSPNKVMFYLAEKPILYEGCEVGLCDWEYLKNKLGEAASSCNLDFCQAGSGVSSAFNAPIIAIVLSFLALVVPRY